MDARCQLPVAGSEEGTELPQTTSAMQPQSPPRPGRSRRSTLHCAAATTLVCLSSGLALIAVALLVPAVVQRKLHQGILDAIIWRPDSPPDIDARFRSNAGPGAPPDLLKAWLFNITNLDEVRAGGLPKLEQVGPFVHRVRREKHDVMWDSQGRVYFKDYTYYQLDTALTPPALLAEGAPNVTTLNLALLGVLANLHGSVGPEYQPFADVLMQAISSYVQSDGVEGVFTSRPALELLWGYDDPLLSLLNALLPPGTLADGAKVRLLRNTSSLEEARGRLPSVFNTGRYDHTHIWNVEADQGRTAVTTWPCEPEVVHGSDASQFTPGLSPNDTLQVFIADLYQSRRLVVHSESELDGLRLLRFWLDPAQDAPNPCRDQELQGLMNITTPQAAGFNGSTSVRGPFVFVSMPLFCGADPRLAEDAGLACDEEAHQTWVDVEPMTGITLRVFKRIQVSSQVGGLGSTLDPSVTPNLTLPLFWAEETVEATPALAAQLREHLYGARWLVAHLGKLAWVAGGLLLALAVLAGVVTVQLAAEPATQRGLEGIGGDASAVAALLDSARRLFRVSSDEPTAGNGSSSRGQRQRRQVQPVQGGSSCSDVEPLLPDGGVAGAAQA